MKLKDTKHSNEKLNSQLTSIIKCETIEKTLKSNSNSNSNNQQPDNITETAATLEISLKSSAELLKQLSSTGHMEHLHLLEKQMKESMQHIERLKSANNNPAAATTSNNNNNIKMRCANSVPSNLKELNVQKQYRLIASNNFQTAYDLHSNHHHHHQQQQQQMALNDAKNIPLTKNVIII